MYNPWNTKKNSIQYIRLKRSVETACKTACNEYLHNFISHNQENPKRFWISIKKNKNVTMWVFFPLKAKLLNYASMPIQKPKSLTLDSHKYSPSRITKQQFIAKSMLIKVGTSEIFKLLNYWRLINTKPITTYEYRWPPSCENPKAILF